LIDFHCHIDLFPKPAEVVTAIDKGNVYVLSVTTTPSAWAKTNQLVRNSAKCRTAVGLHPQVAHERASELDLFSFILKSTKYVGEVGLDCSPEFASTFKTQLEVFTKILRYCETEGGRILSIHSRNSAGPVLDILRANPDAGVPVLHWFSGRPEELAKAIDQDCYFSINTRMVNSNRAIDTISKIPKSRILPESDGPFLQINGRPAMPHDIESVIQCLSRIWNIPMNDTRGIIRDNFYRICSTIEL